MCSCGKGRRQGRRLRFSRRACRSACESCVSAFPVSEFVPVQLGRLKRRPPTPALPVTCHTALTASQRTRASRPTPASFFFHFPSLESRKSNFRCYFFIGPFFANKKKTKSAFIKKKKHCVHKLLHLRSFKGSSILRNLKGLQVQLHPSLALAFSSERSSSREQRTDAEHTGPRCTHRLTRPQHSSSLLPPTYHFGVSFRFTRSIS